MFKVSLYDEKDLQDIEPLEHFENFDNPQNKHNLANNALAFTVFKKKKVMCIIAIVEPTTQCCEECGNANAAYVVGIISKACRGVGKELIAYCRSILDELAEQENIPIFIAAGETDNKKAPQTLRLLGFKRIDFEPIKLQGKTSCLWERQNKKLDRCDKPCYMTHINQDL